GAIAARTVDRLAAAVTSGTRALEREEALRVPDFSGAAASRADFRLGAGFRARAGADFANDGRRNSDLRGLALKGFFERDLHVVAKIRAALAARTAATAATAAHAENPLEDIGESRTEIGAEPVMALALLERGVAETIIGRALVAVLEDVVSL